MIPMETLHEFNREYVNIIKYYYYYTFNNHCMSTKEHQGYHSSKSQSGGTGSTDYDTVGYSLQVLPGHSNVRMENMIQMYVSSSTKKPKEGNIQI